MAWLQVSRNQLWQAVGGRLGFAAIPAVNSEPAKSNSATAQHLFLFYKQYLVNFDRACQMIGQNTVRRQQQAASNAQQQQMQQLQQASTPARVAGSTIYSVSSAASQQSSCMQPV